MAPCFLHESHRRHRERTQTVHVLGLGQAWLYSKRSSFLVPFIEDCVILVPGGGTNSSVMNHIMT